jgi:uncharacterized protein
MMRSHQIRPARDTLSIREVFMLGSLNVVQIERVLRTELTGRLGCHADGRTYVVPVTYVYEEGSVYGQSAEGMKIRMMRKNPYVCFEVDRIEDLANWQSVIAWGTFEELDGEEAVRAMDLLIDRLMPLRTSETGPSRNRGPESTPDASGDGHKLVTYRIYLTEKTGRFERA